MPVLRKFCWVNFGQFLQKFANFRPSDFKVFFWLFLYFEKIKVFFSIFRGGGGRVCARDEVLLSEPSIKTGDDEHSLMHRFSKISDI